MRRALLPLLVAALMGCSSDVWRNECRGPLERQLREDLDQSPTGWVQTVALVQSVLARHYIVTSVDRVHGIIEASSPVRANITTKYRTKATARVFEVGRRVYDAEVRVTNELEFSEPSNLGRGQPTFDWRAVGFDHLAEVALMTEIQAALRGETVTATPQSTYLMFPRPQPVPRRHSDLLRPPVPDPVGGASKAAPSAPAADSQPVPKPMTAAPKAELCQQYLAMGDLCWQRQDLDKAVLEYQRAAVACPQDPAGHLSLAVAWTALRRYSAGAAALREAAAVANGKALSDRDLARLRGPAEELGERLLLLKGWCKQRPDDLDGRLLLAYHLYLAGRADEARASLDDLVRAKPQDAAARFLAQQLGTARL